jgi:hypothetical protein
MDDFDGKHSTIVDIAWARQLASASSANGTTDQGVKKNS